ncbi:MAG TPA: TonB-dependent receptor [Caulobacteraceae bacterium]
MQFDIAPQPLSSALRAYGESAEQQLIYSEADVRRFTAPALQGAYTADEGLAMLLAGTGLMAERTPAGILRIVDASDPQSGSAAGDGADGTVEALIVTAQKREEDIQDVPIAISAFTQEDLTRSQVAGGPDLITQVPNMTFTKTNFSSYSIQLRGIGTQAISATTDPAVAVAFNNTPFIRNRFFEQEFYDLQRVEVLRGPQGTLYGRNATAGVVNIISQKPKFTAESKLSADVSNFSSSRVEGMINIPLVEDVAALRIAGAWTKREGYSTNELTGNPIDGRDLWSTRVSLRVQPTDRLDMNLVWEHFEEDDDRLRSGKQLCKKDVVTDVGGVPVTNYFDQRTGLGQILDYSGTQGTLSQGCKRNSLYAQDSFQRPVGLMLPYYVPLGAVGLPTTLFDPYTTDLVPVDGFLDVNEVSAFNDQPEDLRVIQSTIDPKYRANSDIGELQVSFDLTDNLTLASETSYGVDYIYSLQDFNRFNTAAGAWGDEPLNMVKLVGRGILRTDLGPNPQFCDPQLGCSDRLVAVDVSTAKSYQYSQEFRLSSDYEGPFNFSLGTNFLRYDTHEKYYVFINSLTLVAAVNGGTNFFDGTSPYVGGYTDNTECMVNGYAEGVPTQAYPVTSCVYIDPNPIENVNDKGHNYFLSNNPYKLISYAVFGEAYYNIADNLKLTAGLRWTVDKKEAPRIPTWILVSNSVGYPVAEVLEQEWREPTGRLTVDWKPDLGFTDETMIYGSYAHGYKAGGANPPGYVRIYYVDAQTAEDNAAESATRPTTFEPEFVDAFELGAKNTLLDGALTLNLASFYYDYEGYQVSEIVDRSAFNRNFDATVWGVEFEASWRPMENLRLGFKGGYEKARIADGEQAIDLMDRTAGDPNWTLVRPFPTVASSCIVPTYLYVNPNGTIGGVAYTGGGNPGPCELAYGMGLDPVTQVEYVDLTATAPAPGTDFNSLSAHPGYPGWDPATAPNGGEGIMKDLSGNPLPNAPDWTGTITVDYTLPLPNDWLATLHADLHGQSNSYWRVFDDHEYDKLHPYFTMNLAAIFTNEEQGWNIMAYVKNVTDSSAITGAFLNSDDTGLTTNVFLVEPRLYGLRVTKAWTGAPVFASLAGSPEGPFPLTVELGGQAQRHDAPNDPLMPSFADEFEGPLAIFDDSQAEDLDVGDGREVKVTWRPGGSWWLSAGWRKSKANVINTPSADVPTPPICAFAGIFDEYCEYPELLPSSYQPFISFSVDNRLDTRVYEREEHNLIDFMVGHDLGFGSLKHSSVAAGLRYASLESETSGDFRGIPDWVVKPFFIFLPDGGIRTLYRGQIEGEREFKGWGPVVEWDASLPLLDVGQGGSLNLDWSTSAGVLFGEQETNIVTLREEAQAATYNGFDLVKAFASQHVVQFAPLPAVAPISRSSDETVPMYGASLGLSYEVSRFKVGAGYRWERYVDAIDGGFEEHQSEDRTIDGPYFKLSVGFGG